MKRKVNSIVAVLVVLAVVGVIGAIMYMNTQPPVVGSKGSFDAERQRMMDTRQALLGMKKSLDSKAAKGSSAAPKKSAASSDSATQ